MPILQRQEIIGAMAIIFFSVGVKMNEAEQRFVPTLHATARQIDWDLAP